MDDEALVYGACMWQRYLWLTLIPIRWPLHYFWVSCGRGVIKHCGPVQCITHNKIVPQRLISTNLLWSNCRWGKCESLANNTASQVFCSLMCDSVSSRARNCILSYTVQHAPVVSEHDLCKNFHLHGSANYRRRGTLRGRVRTETSSSFQPAAMH